MDSHYHTYAHLYVLLHYDANHYLGYLSVYMLSPGIRWKGGEVKLRRHVDDLPLNVMPMTT